MRSENVLKRGETDIFVEFYGVPFACFACSLESFNMSSSLYIAIYVIFLSTFDFISLGGKTCLGGGNLF